MIVPSIASIRFTWPPTWFAQVGAVGVLEVGHEAAGARVERVDDELAVGRPGDLDAAVLVVRARRARPASRPRGSRASPRGSRACRRRAAPRRARGGRPAARARRAPKRPCSSATNVERVGRDGCRREPVVGVGATSRRMRPRFIGRVPRIEWSSSVIGWRSAARCSRCAAICSAQPGLAAAIASAPGGGEVRGLARAQLAPRPPAARGCRSRPSRSRAPTRPARPARGRGSRAAARAAGSRTPCAWARWQASW